MSLTGQRVRILCLIALTIFGLTPVVAVAQPTGSAPWCRSPGAMALEAPRVRAAYEIAVEHINAQVDVTVLAYPAPPFAKR